MNASLSHIAILTRNAEKAADVCKKSGYEVGAVEDFPSEGTREIYIGSPGDGGLLLLMQDTGPGPYRSAMEKRGPGLHHIAVNVGSIDEYVASLAGSGWLLHPRSLQTLKQSKTVYLARPGLKVLIEVQQINKKSSPKDCNSFISEVFVEGSLDHQRLLNSLAIPGLRIAGKEGAGLLIAGKLFSVAQFTKV